MPVTRWLLNRLMLALLAGWASIGQTEVLQYLRYDQHTYLLPTDPNHHGDLTYQNDTQSYTFSETVGNVSQNITYTITTYELFRIPGPELGRLRLSRERHVTLFKEGAAIRMAVLDANNDQVVDDFTLFDISHMESAHERVSVALNNCPVDGVDRVLATFLFQDGEAKRLYVIAFSPDGNDPPQALLGTGTLEPIYQEANPSVLANFHTTCVGGELVLFQLGVAFGQADSNHPRENGIYLYHIARADLSVEVPEGGVEVLSNSGDISAGKLKFLGGEKQGQIRNIKCAFYDANLAVVYAAGQLVNQRYRFMADRYLYVLPLSFDNDWMNEGYQGGNYPVPINASDARSMEYCFFQGQSLKALSTMPAEDNGRGYCRIQTVVATLPLDKIPLSTRIAERRRLRKNQTQVENPEPLLCVQDVDLMPAIVSGGVVSFVTSLTFSSMVIVCLYAKRRLAPGTDDVDADLLLMGPVEGDVSL